MHKTTSHTSDTKQASSVLPIERLESGRLCFGLGLTINPQNPNTLIINLKKENLMIEVIEDDKCKRIH